MMDIITVLGSAGVGALVGSLVSTIVTELGKSRERKSRREELALSKAVDMAHEHARLVIDSGSGEKIAPDVLMLEDYYRSLKHILDHEKLDSGMRARVSRNLAKVGIDIDNR